MQIVNYTRPLGIRVVGVRENENFRGNLVVYRDKASGSRVEIQSLPTLYPAVHPFHPIPLYPLGRMLWISLKTYTECAPYIYYPCLHCDEKENKDLIWFDLIYLSRDLLGVKNGGQNPCYSSMCIIYRWFDISEKETVWLFLNWIRTLFWMANGWMCGLTLFGLKKLSNLFIYVFNPFIFNKQKRRVISSEGFSALKKNCPSSRVQQTAADYNSCLRF